MVGSSVVVEQERLLPKGTGTGTESRLEKGVESLGSKVPGETSLLAYDCFTPSLSGHFIDIMNIRQSGGDGPPTQQESIQQQLPDSNSEGSQAMAWETFDNSSYINGEDPRLISILDKDQGQSDTFFSLSDHSSWTSNEGSDSETGKISLELGSETSYLASEQEQVENDKVTTVRKKQKKGMHNLIQLHTHQCLGKLRTFSGIIQTLNLWKIRP
ncbi:hypothetical protein NDU88_004357 [Pleurodeles waltl]|uniref:Uncharacterized protein n=1 Tax=Pleurodeles waltl TaxID=8319 RepID=A0AAV7W6E4_PLEWA|nr:hypothetical protein NDU88_004357 [Pleurodeles waltl]